jgi:type III pantothenate kinase
MAESVLLIDQGNTRLKWVRAVNGKIDKDSAGSGDYESFRQAHGPGASEPPDSILISSVAGGEETQSIARFCTDQMGVDAALLQSRAEQGGVRNGYREPETLGVDRWLAIVGAVSRYGKPAVIWDLGTATTLDAVDETGQHLGGLILPGPDTMLNSLRRDTRLQVPPAGEQADVSPGCATSEGISHGVLAAQLGALNQFLRVVTTRFNSDSALIVTGGAAKLLLASLDFDHIHDPWLLFRGMLVD